MLVKAQQVFQEIDIGVWKPFYVLAGEESFQISTIVERIRAQLTIGSSGGSPTEEFNYESWDGEGLDAEALLLSLNLMPGLFDTGTNIRLIQVKRFEKVSQGSLEVLQEYFENPSPSTVLLVAVSKVDKRKSWYRAMDEKGYILEVQEPTLREWPKWQPYFEKKIGKRMDATAWQVLVETANYSLGPLWSELQKVAVFVGDKKQIGGRDVSSLCLASGDVDVFEWVADVMMKKRTPSLSKFRWLVKSGESEIKLLALLVRQFRQLELCLKARENGVVDNRTIAQIVGIAPHFVPALLEQARFHSRDELNRVFLKLSDCDYRMKIGEEGLSEGFLLPYLSGNAL